MAAGSDRHGPRHAPLVERALIGAEDRLASGAAACATAASRAIALAGAESLGSARQQPHRHPPARSRLVGERVVLGVGGCRARMLTSAILLLHSGVVTRFAVFLVDRDRRTPYLRIMPFFVPLTPPLGPPPLGAAIERAVMDWKAVDAGTPFHKAKDVAAFANHLGGTLLIGACEKDGQLDAYKGMTPAEAGTVRDAYSKAIKDKCQPHPTVDFEEFSAPGDHDKRIVAVNVWPSLLLVGVEIAAHKPSEGYGGTSFVYPVRSGTDATYLEPSQIAMYMTPQVRRIAVLLSKIPKDAVVRIRRPEGYWYHEYPARIDEVLEDKNIATFLDPQGTHPMLPVPLDRITTVYEDWDPNTKAKFWSICFEPWNAPPPPRPFATSSSSARD